MGRRPAANLFVAAKSVFRAGKSAPIRGAAALQCKRRIGAVHRAGAGTVSRRAARGARKRL